MGKASTDRVERTCVACGKAFSVFKSQLKVRKAIYCGPECYQENRTGAKLPPRGARSGLPKLPPRGRIHAERACIECGALYRPRSATAKYCSRPCLYKHNTGETSPHWKGGRYVTTEGYVRRFQPQHPNADATGYVLEHRLVLEEQLGRLLEKDETVHHLNGVHDDNRPENLQVMRGRHGRGVCLVCADCGSTNIVTRELHPEPAGPGK